jgi:enamine deaminase RidA (YjgF/YER057c/UK114 family)
MIEKDIASSKILQPPHWVRPKGYANGVSARGRTVFVCGMIGWDAQGRLVAKDIVGQVRQTLLNIVVVLAEGGAKPEHIVRMTWYVVNKKEYVDASQEIGAVYREIIGTHYPAMTAVLVAELMEDCARVEIEVTAMVPE